MTTPLPFYERVFAFFQRLFAGCTGTIFLLAIEPDGGHPQTGTLAFPYDLAHALNWAAKHSEAGRNVYFCPVTMRPGAPTRSEANAAELSCLFADIDLNTCDKDTIVAAAEKLLDRGRVTALIGSGYGIHAYAKLAVPIAVTDDCRSSLKDALYAFGAGLNASVLGDGVHRPDRFDLASLLRVPGTINFPSAKKRAAGRLPAKTGVLLSSKYATVQLEDFSDWIAQYPRPHHGKAGSTSTGGVGAIPDAFATWLAEDSTLRGYFERTLTPQGPDQSASAYALALSNRLAKTHPEITDGEALAILQAFYEEYGEHKGLAALQLTWVTARAAYPSDGGHDAQAQAATTGQPGADALPSVASAEPAAVDVLPFPTDALPDPLRPFVEEGAAAMSCPPEFFAVPMLTLAGAAIGTSYELEVKPSWRERPCLYAAIVGNPGSVKSPALAAVARPVYRRQAAFFTYWELARAQHAKELKEWEEQGKNGPKPRAPLLVRTFTDDTTTEALAAILRDNPRGVPIIRDELTGWVRSMNSYKQRGADREFYLKAWSGGTVAVDRKGTHELGPIIVLNPFVSVIGGVTPDLLGELGDELGREDGFLHRLLFAFPPDQPQHEWTGIGISPGAAKGWQDTLTRLWALHPKKAIGGPVPNVLAFTESGRKAFVEFYNAHNAERADPVFPYALRGPWKKLEGYCARLALILHLSRVAGDGKTPEHTEKTADVSPVACPPDVPPVDEVAVQGAVRLIDYFKSHARRVYQRVPASPQEHKDDQALAWIKKQGGSVSARDVQKNHVAGVKNGEDAKALLSRLAGRGLGTIKEKDKNSVVFTLIA